MTRCVCGQVADLGDGEVACELGGVRHRSNGPCYHCDTRGEAVPAPWPLAWQRVLPNGNIQVGVDIVDGVSDEVTAIVTGLSDGILTAISNHHPEFPALYADLDKRALLHYSPELAATISTLMQELHRVTHQITVRQAAAEAARSASGEGDDGEGADDEVRDREGVQLEEEVEGRASVPDGGLGL